MRTAALGLAVALLCAAPVAADPYRALHFQTQAEVFEACGGEAFHCATWITDAAGNPVCIMRVPLGLEQQNLERFNEVLADLRADCANPQPQEP